MESLKARAKKELNLDEILGVDPMLALGRREVQNLANGMCPFDREVDPEKSGCAQCTIVPQCKLEQRGEFSLTAWAQSRLTKLK